MPDRRRALIALTALFSGAATWAQASPNRGPWRTLRDGSDERLMLEGHDAVAYFRQNEAVKGNPAIALQWQGVTWRFATESHRADFERDPDLYAPQFGGYCSNGINYAIPWGGGGAPNSWRIYRGRLYVFGGQKARDHFEVDTEANLKLAHQYWDSEVVGSNALLTRWRRLIFRVPHYKTDAQLQSDWEARRAAGTLPVMPGAAQVVPAR